MHVICACRLDTASVAPSEGHESDGYDTGDDAAAAVTGVTDVTKAVDDVDPAEGFEYSGECTDVNVSLR
jgi:hypothetical protein